MRYQGCKWLVCVLGCLMWAGLADAQTFREPGFGLSFEPPAGWQRIDEPSDGSLAMWVDPQGVTLNFSISDDNTTSIETTDDVVNLLFTQLGFVASDPALRAWKDGEQASFQKRRIADRPGVVLFFDIESAPPLAVQFNKRARQRMPDKGRWFLGSAMVRLDPTTVALWQVLTPEQHDATAEPALRELVETIALMPPDELNRWREQRLGASLDWLNQSNRATLVQASAGESWHRLLEGDQDVGFVHRRVVTDLAEILREKLVPDVRDGGYMVVERTVLPPRQAGERPVEHILKTYTDAAGQSEVWTLNITAYPPAPGSSQALPSAGDASTQRAAVWTQTGSRDGRDLTVLSEHPPDPESVREITRAEQFRGERRARPIEGRFTERFWAIPDPQQLPAGPDQPNAQRMQIDPAAVYLSQADLFTLPRHLPHEQPGEFAFYAFDVGSETMALRSYSVTPLPDGGYRIDERPTARRAVVSTTYNADGQPLEERLPNGQRLIPATHEQILSIWKK